MQTQPTPNKYDEQNGSILITIIVILFVLSSILGGVLTLSTQYLSLSKSRIDSEQALYLAEAGLERACTQIEANGIGNYSGGDSIGDGSFTYVTTKDGFYRCSVEAEGKVNGKIRALKLSGVRNASYAEYSFWVDDNGSVVFATDDIFDGKVHTGSEPYFSGSPIFNGKFTSSASTYGSDPGSTNSVKFNEGYEYGVELDEMSEVSLDDMQTHATTNTTTDTLLLTGATEIYFNYTQILISNENEGWTDHSYTLADEQLVYIQGGMVTTTNTTTTTTEEYVNVGNNNGDYKKKNNGEYKYVGDNNGKYELQISTSTSTEISTEDSPGTLTLSGGKLDGRLTIITEDDIYINNSIEYALDPLDTNACNTAIAEAADLGEDDDYDAVVNDALGLVSGDDVIVTTEAPKNIQIDASIMALGDDSGTQYSDSHKYDDYYDGCFVVDDFDDDTDRGNIYLLGGIIQSDRGPVGLTSGEGYSKNYAFDLRFSAYPPPYFPPLGEGLTFQSWEETTND
jgi:Tfp pilus assembly protein PilX